LKLIDSVETRTYIGVDLTNDLNDYTIFISIVPVDSGVVTKINTLIKELETPNDYKTLNFKLVENTKDRIWFLMIEFQEPVITTPGTLILKK
jgi:hypothetical protein